MNEEALFEFGVVPEFVGQIARFCPITNGIALCRGIREEEVVPYLKHEITHYAQFYGLSWAEYRLVDRSYNARLKSDKKTRKEDILERMAYECQSW